MAVRLFTTEELSLTHHMLTYQDTSVRNAYCDTFLGIHMFPPRIDPYIAHTGNSPGFQTWLPIWENQCIYRILIHIISYLSSAELANNAGQYSFDIHSSSLRLKPDPTYSHVTYMIFQSTVRYNYRILQQLLVQMPLLQGSTQVVISR